MKRNKIIQISPTSSSFWLNIGKGKIKKVTSDEWFAQNSKQIKRINPEMSIECWNQERLYSHKLEFKEKNLRFKTFPTIVSIRPGMEFGWPMIKELNQEIENSKKQNKKLVIHLHEYHSWQAYLILLVIKKNKKIRIIAQHHGGRSPLKNLEKYKRLFFVLPMFLLMQILENVLFKKIDVFYSLSDEETKYLKKIAPKSKIKFQTMGIGQEYFKREDKEKIKKKLSLDLNKKYFLYIGRIKTTKGIKELLDAMKKVENEKVELLIIGGGPDFDKYKNYLIQNKIKRVKFLGPIYSKKKLDYLSACDCLILPSYTEGAPVVLMEAIAKNLPVIATDVGGVNKMIEDGREGIIIKPKSSEEIMKAINEILKWKKKEISKYAEKYKWENIVKETMGDYGE